MKIFFIIFGVLMPKFSATTIWLKKSVNHHIYTCQNSATFHFLWKLWNLTKQEEFIVYSVQNKYMLIYMWNFLTPLCTFFLKCLGFYSQIAL